MTIERLNENIDTTEKIRQLNEMIMELSGKIDQGKFDVNELDQIFTDTGMDRKYLRNTNLGHTVGTYTGWTHLKAETGYSIWKFTPTSYSYSALNQLYLDNAKLTNMGQATSESVTSFDKVFMFDGPTLTYTDNTTEAGTETGTEFSLMDGTTDYLYVGLSTTFTGIKFEFQTRGSGYDLEVMYYNGSAWVDLTASGYVLTDGTSDFESDGLISFTAPGDWATTTVNSSSKYWIRIKTNVTPVTVAKAYFVVPGTSVIGLLAMDSSDIIAGNWAWCTYSSSVYVTIRNSGGTTKEGDLFITSSSTAINLQNYFIYNHTYSLDYLDSTYLNSYTSNSKLSQSVFVATASKNINTSVAETTLFGTGSGSLTIPANYLAIAKSIRVRLRGFFGTTGTPTLNIKLKMGSVTICSTGAVATVGTLSSNYWEFDGIITCRTIGASGTVFGQGNFSYDDSLHAGKSVGAAATATATVDTTSAIVLDVTATWGTSNISNTITCTNAIVEILY